MSVNIQIPGPLREHAGGAATVAASGATVQAALADLIAKHPGLENRLFDKGQVRRFINLYLNNEDVRFLDNLTTPVKDGDELAIIPAVAGG
jgi:molybdopterin converting factor small subunit